LTGKAQSKKAGAAALKREFNVDQLKEEIVKILTPLKEDFPTPLLEVVEADIASKKYKPSSIEYGW
jgi:hypothetical protein